MRQRLVRALTAIFDGSNVTPLAVKVPQITFLFWVIKIVSTAMGEALADFLDGGNGLVFPAIGALSALAAFIIAMRIQFRTTRYVTAAYWFAVAMVATFGTMAADSLHQFGGIPYSITTPFYAVVLALVFWRWWANEHTLSIHTIDYSPPGALLLGDRVCDVRPRNRDRRLERHQPAAGVLQLRIAVCWRDPDPRDRLSARRQPDRDLLVRLHHHPSARRVVR